MKSSFCRALALSIALSASAFTAMAEPVVMASTTSTEQSGLFAHQSPSAVLVFASHNLGQVKRLASRVIYLQQGRVLADLPVAEFFDRDRVAQHHPEVDAFLRGETV